MLLSLTLAACGVKQTELEARMEPVQTQTETLQAEQQRLEERLDLLERSLASGASSVPGKAQPVPPPTVIPFKPGQTAPGGSAPVKVTSSDVSAGGTTGAKAAGTGEQGAYQKALGAYEQRRYAEAEKLFAAFIEAYPSSKLLPNALYWKAESLYSRGNYADAVFGFKDVGARFAGHPKAADSLLKAAMSYSRLKDPDNAALHLNILKEDYPNSTALRRARELNLLP